MSKQNETERRYLITGRRPNLTGLLKRNILQGYLRADPEESLRIRLFVGDNGELEEAIITRKCGTGEQRPEEEEELASPGAARLLHDSAKYRLRKDRYFKDGWTVDCFHDALEGLMIAEFERPEGTPAPPPPEWIGEYLDITETVSNAGLAKLAYDLEGAVLHEPLAKLLTWRIPKIVITGPPGSGKSGAIKHLMAKPTFSAFHFIPEVATIVFQNLGRPGEHPLNQKRFSRGIGNVQLEFEMIAEVHAKNSGHAAMVMDRGLADGFAYNDKFESTMSMPRKAMHKRYDLVIFMALPNEEIYNVHKANNPARTETYAEAAALGQRTYAAWEDHSHFVVVPGGMSWEERLLAVEHALRRAIAGNA